jgi:hypothetical protein
MTTAQEAAAPHSQGRIDRYAPYAAGLLLAIPSLIARYVPMTDLPMHEAVVGIMRHFGDDSYFPRDLYTLNLGFPNQLFYFVGWALAWVFGTGMAVKIVVASAQFLIFVAGARFADHVGRPRWSALLLAPLALGFTYYWGLVANLIGFAAFLFALPILDRMVERPTPRRLASTSAVLVLLYFTHESVLAAAVCVIVFLALCQPLTRTTWLRLFPAIAAVVGMVIELLLALEIHTTSLPSLPATFFTLPQRLFFFANALYGSYDFSAQFMLLGLGIAGALVLLANRIQARRAAARAAAAAPAPPAPAAPARTGRLERLRAFVYAYRFECIGASFLLAYFILPFNFKAVTLLHERFLGPAWGVLVLCAGPRGAPTRLAKLACAVLPLGVIFAAWPQFIDSDRAFRDLDAIVEQVPKGSAVTSVTLDPKTSHRRVYSAGVGPGRVAASRGGRASISLMISAISPVQIRPEFQWNEHATRMVFGASRAMQPAHDLKEFGWVIGESRDPWTRGLLKEALAPDAELIAERGEWMLFRSRYPHRPIDSPELPPDPHAETVLERVDRIIGERRAAAAARKEGRSPDDGKPEPQRDASPEPAPSTAP